MPNILDAAISSLRVSDVDDAKITGKPAQDSGVCLAEVEIF
jgi:hypothetical protein